MRRTCPHCRSRVSLRTVVFPRYVDGKHLIRCPKCNVSLSNFWDPPPLFPAIVAGILMVIFVEWLHFGWFTDLMLIGGFTGVIVVVAYWFIPFEGSGP